MAGATYEEVFGSSPTTRRPAVADFASAGPSYEDVFGAAPQGPGIVRAATQGALRNAPGQIGGMIDMATRFLRNLAVPGSAPAPEGPGTLERAGTRLGEAVAGPYRPPVTPGERLAERGGEALGWTAATAPLVLTGAPGIAAGATRLGIEGVSAVTGALAGQGAREMGAPEWVATPLDIAVSAGGPALARSVAGGQMSRVASDKTGGVSRDISGLDEAQRRLRLLLPEGEEAAAIRSLTDEIADQEELARLLGRTPEQTGGLTLAQALGEEGGQGVAAAEASLAREAPEFQRGLAGQRIREGRLLRELATDVRGPGGRSVLDTVDDVYAKGVAAERDAWRRARNLMPELGRVPTETLKAGATQALRDAGVAGAEDLPSAVNTILEKYGDEIPFEELQTLRSKLLETIRSNSLPQGNHRTRFFAETLMRSVDDTIEGLRPGTVASEAALEVWTEARTATRELRGLFDERSSYVRRLLQGSENLEEVRTLRSVLGNPKEAARLRAIAEKGGAESVAGLEAQFFDELMGPELSHIRGRTAGERLRQYEDTARAVLGDDKVRRLKFFVRRLEKLQATRAGTPAAAHMTGSNVPAAGALLSMIDALVAPNPVAAAAQIAKRGAGSRAVQWVTRNVAPQEAEKIMRAALRDPRLARDLLANPANTEFPGWALRMKGYIARAGVRAVGTAD
jgi:hypothetical protein